jgi:hypothetical protein
MRGLLAVLLWLAIGVVQSATASEVVTIGAALSARQPQLAVDDHGRIHLTFGSEGSIFYTCSTDNGSTYKEPVEVGRLKALSLGMRRGPRIAVARQSIVISAIGGEKGGGRDGDLFAWRSEDHGKSWQGPARVNDVTSSAREGLHGMAAGPKGDVVCVWLDLRNKGTQLFASRCVDGGSTWSGNSLVYKSPGGSICECCHPSVVYDRRGALYVMWRNSLGGNRDMYWTTSEDGGSTFAKAEKLGQGSWKLDACPMDGGAAAITNDGKLAAVWRRDKQVFLTADNSSDEHNLGTGLQPWLAAGDRGLYSVWIADRPGNLYLASSSDHQQIKLASQARDPVVAVALTPKAPVVVAWETDENGHPVIKATAIRD